MRCVLCGKKIELGYVVFKAGDARNKKYLCEECYEKLFGTETEGE